MIRRRGFLKLGLAGACLLAAGGGTLALRRTRLRRTPSGLRVLGPAEYAVLAAVADRIVAAEAGAPTTDDLHVVEKADAVLFAADEATRRDFRRLLALFDNALVGLLTAGTIQPFTALPAERQDAMLRAWESHRLPALRTGFQALKRLTAACYYASPGSYAAVGYPGPPEIQTA